MSSLSKKFWSFLFCLWGFIAVAWCWIAPGNDWWFPAGPAGTGAAMSPLGERIDDLPLETRDEHRNRVFGFVFQFYHLLPELTLLENVLSPLMIRYSAWDYWKRKGQLREQAEHIIERVGLSHRLKHKPAELSGGEMQRTAIARALISQPQVLLADEPTGNLDATSGGEIMDLLLSLNAEEQLTIIMVTHDGHVAEQAGRIVRLSEGRIQRLEEAAA